MASEYILITPQLRCVRCGELVKVAAGRELFICSNKECKNGKCLESCWDEKPDWVRICFDEVISTDRESQPTFKG